MMFLAMCFSFQHPCTEQGVGLDLCESLCLDPDLGELGTSQERRMEKT